MKKILIVCDSLRMGGIQKSLINFLNHIDTSKYNVDLFLFSKINDFEHNINPNIKIKSARGLLKIANYTNEYAKRKGIIFLIIRKIIAFLCLIFTSNFIYSLLFLFQKKIGDYDIAISYSNNVSNKSIYFGSNKFILEKVNSKIKISYVHIDYDLIYSKFINSEYQKFDYIWFVSNYIKDEFLKYNKYLEKKCFVLNNFIDEEFNVKNTEKFITNKKFNIVTIGRLDENKSQIDSINVACQLVKRNIDFEWILIGNGPEYLNIKNEIENNNLTNYVKLVGNKKNVVDYLKNADVFVSFSKSESYGLAIAEALMANVIVVARFFPAVLEVINDNGIVCSNNEEIVDNLYKLFTNKSEYIKWKNKSFLKFNNDKNLKKLEELLEMK